MPGSTVFCLRGLAQIHIHSLVGLSNHLFRHHPLFLLPSIFPSKMVFLHQVAKLLKLWPQQQFFDEYHKFISFKIYCLDLFEIQGTTKSSGFHSVCPLQDKDNRLMEAERLTERETGSYSDGWGHAQ